MDIRKCKYAGRKEKYSNYSNCVFFFCFVQLKRSMTSENLHSNCDMLLTL